jgi:hypothetical protein
VEDPCPIELKKTVR